jgi:hypothetical protein
MQVEYRRTGTQELSLVLGIKDPGTEPLARELAKRTGETLTVAARRALEERLRRISGAASRDAARRPRSKPPSLEQDAGARFSQTRRDHRLQRERAAPLMVIDGDRPHRVSPRKFDARAVDAALGCFA